MSIQRLKGYQAPGQEPPLDPGGNSGEQIMDNATDENYGGWPSPWDEMFVHGNPPAPEFGKDGDASA